MRVSRLGKRKSLRDERLDLLLLQEVEQGDQILSKLGRLQPFERLDAVGDGRSLSGMAERDPDVLTWSLQAGELPGVTSPRTANFLHATDGESWGEPGFHGL